MTILQAICIKIQFEIVQVYKFENDYWDFVAKQSTSSPIQVRGITISQLNNKNFVKLCQHTILT